MIGLFQKPEGPKDDSRQQAAAPAVVAMTDVVSLMKYDLRYMAHGLWSGEWVLSYPYQKRESETICNLMQYIKVYIYSCPETMLTLPSLCHNILVVQNWLDILQNITLVHCIMLIKPNVQDVASMLEALLDIPEGRI